MRSFRLGPGVRTSDRILGCGCTIAIGLFFLALAFGAIMGDYIGPPEGAAANSRRRGTLVLVGLGGAFLAAAAGWRLVRRD